MLMQSQPLPTGAQLFQTHCTSCHGMNLQGTSQGLPLINVDAAEVDYELQTGRMPAAIPWEQEYDKPPQFPPAQIAAIVDYVMSKSSGDKTLPTVNVPPFQQVSSETLERGREIYEANCEHCHSATGHGMSVGFQNVAPPLMDVRPQQLAEAVRTGPDVMPKFGSHIIDDRGLSDLVAYVEFLQRGQYNPGGLQLADWGPVSEGFIAWTVGIGLLVLLVRRIGTTD